MNPEYISIRHLSKKFQKDYVLKDVNASLKKGEILGFLGPSGAGKTTTIKILTGQLRPTSGEAQVLGIDCTRIDERIYEQIGIVTDVSGVYERMSVYDNLKYFARLLNAPLSSIDPLLARTGLEEHRKKPAAKLSRGQTQRLILARAVLHRPKILFLDEPTSGLDPSTALDIHRLLTELRDDGMAVFLTTHNMEEATKLCGHVALLNEGVIVEYGTPREICLGSLIPVILMQAAVNVLCVFAAGFSMSAPQWVSYLAVTSLCAVIGSVIGMIFGIFAKNQMSAGTITTPALLILMMIPMFSPMIGSLEKISSFLFTGVAYSAILRIHMGEPPVEPKDAVILLAETVLAILVFLFLYRKNGFER